MSSFSTLVLAAGKGTRMKSPLPKVLHRAIGLPLLGHVLKAASQAGATKNYVIIGHCGDEVLRYLQQSGTSFQEVWQTEQKGTGHAVQVALPYLEQEQEIVILSGDSPLLKPQTLHNLLMAHRKSKADLTLGTMHLENPYGYGRVVLGARAAIKRIVEEKEATEKEKKIQTVNGGLYVVSRRFLKEALPKLKPSKKTGEYYLTDILAIGAAKKKKLFAYDIPAQELMGVNTLLQLAEAENVLRMRILQDWMENGVRVQLPETIWAESDVVCEAGAVIGPHTVLQGKTHIAVGATIEAGCVLKDVRVEAGAQVKAYSCVESAVIRRNAQIGPFARVRPGTDIGEEAKIGNFVELKNAQMGAGAKASHLSYIGDAEIGAGVNIGCGFIACNYDGVNKHKTIIEEGAFVGSDVQAVAPVTIGKNAYVATGTTVTKNVPEDALAIARVKQENKEGYAAKLRARMQAIKKARKEN